MTVWPLRARPTPEAALEDVTSGDPEARIAAIESLASAPESLAARAGEALAERLGDPHPRVRAAAALALAELGPSAHLDRLEERTTDEDVRVRQAAVIALGESGDHRALPALERALEAAEGDVRFQAVLAVARNAPERALELVGPLASDEDPEVRANVAAALADVGGDAALPKLEELLGDRDLAVRFEAALSFADRGDGRALKPLVLALEERDIAPQAVRGLGILRDPAGAPALAALLGRWTAAPTLKAAAAASLAAIDPALGGPALDRWLAARRREPRAMAIHAAGELRLGVAVPSLLALLADRKCPDRDAVAHALGAIGDDRAVVPLQAAADDDDPYVAEESRAALAAIEERAALTGSPTAI